MTDDDFQAFVDDCFEQLEQKQSDLQTVYGIGTYPRWHLDQTTEKLRFFDSSDQLAVQAHVINIGSFASNSN
ncbi:MAG TPA: hypothetical protein PKD17_08530, partial [Cellvibrionaceae bacterium]|nr:hypothetical protein [Cellvibrionaceae bacterium]